MKRAAKRNLRKIYKEEESLSEVESKFEKAKKDFVAMKHSDYAEKLAEILNVLIADSYSGLKINLSVDDSCETKRTVFFNGVIYAFETILELAGYGEESDEFEENNEGEEEDAETKTD